MRATIIRTDGREEQHELPLETTPHGLGAPFVKLEELIGASCFDTVNLRDGRVMLVDDGGHVKGLPTNQKATALYWSVCRPGTTHEIVGDVAIVRDEDFA